jgi:hypothetical protein
MQNKKRRVDVVIETERMYEPSRKAMKAALRVVLGWPPVLEETKREQPETQGR